VVKHCLDQSLKSFACYAMSAISLKLLNLSVDFVSMEHDIEISKVYLNKQFPREVIDQLKESV
jgi:hypothetical protein